jgi:hypothetical protein
VRPLLNAVLAAFVLGLLAGASSALYRPEPRPADEARLRARALAYYRAAKVFDFRTMASLYTPARQLDEERELRELVAKRSKEFATFQAETKSDLQFSADSIKAEELSLGINGNWATTEGSSAVRLEGEDGRIALEKLVWVQSGGDWWIYSMKLPELAAYGNPPDNLRELLTKPRSGERTEVTIDQSPESSPGTAGAGAPTDTKQPDGDKPNSGGGE